MFASRNSAHSAQRDDFNGRALGTAFQYREQYTDMADYSRGPTSPTYPGIHGLSPRRRAAQVAGMNGYNASTDLPPPLYVRALYTYEADDQTSLSFRQGDVIQVITQLESGWWDGMIDNTRGWFPSNYCVVIDPDDPHEPETHDESEISEQSGTEEEYDDGDDSDARTQDDDCDLPIEGISARPQDESSGFWIPQATPDGRLFYFNTRTGISSMELPLETPGPTDYPPDSNYHHVPAQTRPPPEMMAGGYHHEEDYDGSESEAFKSRRSARRNTNTNQSSSVLPNGTSATSFTVPTINGHDRSSGAPRHFADDAVTSPPTWEQLADNMQNAIDSYRLAVQRGERAEYVRRAEDISDHLRMLLNAGSGTIDNHYGAPPMIASNKALYPHFREMMSKFSKLMLSSHIAATDRPSPDSGAKCLFEAEGVMNGVYGFIEVARQQRGDELPRSLPGFVAGALVGGSWNDNNINTQYMGESGSFADQNDAENRAKAAVPLDKLSLQHLEQLRVAALSSLSRLQDQLFYSEKTVTPAQQADLGDSICLNCGAFIEQFRSWLTAVESIDLSPAGTVFQNPGLLEFGNHKQSVYDLVGQLVAVCQATTSPLPDEWAEVRGETLETRLMAVKAVCRQLDTHIGKVNYSLQVLESSPTTSKAPRREHRVTAPTETLQSNAQRLKDRPQLADMKQPASYHNGQDPNEARRPIKKDKAEEFFGAVPPGTLGDDAEPPKVSDELPWFLAMDHANEVHRDTKQNPPQVKSGTIAGLVEQLTRHDRPDPTFNTTFLLTYRSFISAAELFESLVRRFTTQPPGGLSREEMLVWEEQKQKPVRFRVVNILKTWIEHYWMESNDPESKQLLERINDFARNTVTNAKIPYGAPLAAVIDQRMRGQDTSAKKLVLTLTGNAPPSLIPKKMKNLKFGDIDPLEFARQLTIVEARLYGKIKPVECLEKIWEKRDSDESGGGGRAPNVRALILHSNQVTNCVAEMILNHQEVKRRVNVIKQFVAIAEKCRLLNNFSSLTAIVSALGTAPILRLNRTWAQLPNKTKESLENMRTLIASTKNFSRYREALHAAQPPCIPFMGVYLTDLTFIEDGIASMIKNTELINFTKRTKTAEVIRDIQQYQNVPYTLTEVPELRDWILDNMRQATDVHEMYNKSLQIEPREREEEKIARLLSESGFL